MNKGELGEGLTLDKAGAFAYTATVAGKILKVSLADGTTTEVGVLAQFPQGRQDIYVVGLAFDAAENLDIAVTSFGPAYTSGIYRLAKGGSVAALRTQVAGFPNGLSFAPDGTCFVSNSFGQIQTVSASGDVSSWFSEPGLTDGDASSSCATGFGIGANGIHATDEAVYFTNSDRAQMVKVARKGDGTAGDSSFVVPSNCATFNGADGVAPGPNGSFYVASNQQNALLKVTSAGVVSVVASGSLFAFPSSVAYSAKDSAVYVINAAFGDVKKPGIVKVPVQNN
ncbi:MAG: hypothetical protein VKO21_11005 [Candidatus Sericytochromatia bacterium]|nr:hypothetical protein [Candidatus Sericytochromatia bacterium]